MPNHVHNIITFNADPETLKTIADQIATRRGSENTINFEKIIPMPDYIFRGNLGEKEMQQYGANNWYDWSVSNWGTKWNAYDGTISEDLSTYEFNTAWSAPEPIYEKLSEMFPDVEIDIRYADEFIGQYSGCVKIKNGMTVHVDMSEGAVDNAAAIEFACKVWGESPENFGLVYDQKQGRYVYKEDAEDSNEGE